MSAFWAVLCGPCLSRCHGFVRFTSWIDVVKAEVVDGLLRV